MLVNQPIEPKSLPQWQPEQFESMAPNAPMEGALSNGISYGAILLLSGFLAVVIPNPNYWVFAVTVVVIVVLMMVSIFYCFAVHKIRGVLIREHDVLFKNGLIWRTVTAVPISRIQHVEVARGLFERKLGLATLKLFTAGGSGADLKISGLEYQRAEQVREFLLARHHQLTSEEESVG